MNPDPALDETLSQDATLGTGPDLDASFEWCRRLSRSTAGNFYYAFRVLPKDRFRDTCALYAFMRIADDIGDDESIELGERRTGLTRWRESMSRALDDRGFDHPCLPALADVVRRNRIPRPYLDELVDGVESDLDHAGFQTFADLERYCYHVAGVVGICCLYVWGMKDERATAPAIDLGTAFQLTNILRDVGEDARNGRVYLPREDLERFGVDPDNLAAGTIREPFREMMRFQVGRARDFYERGTRVFDDVEPEAHPILSAMIRIYRGLLDEIERRDYDVLHGRVRLSGVRKLWISLDTIVRRWSGRSTVVRAR